MSKQQVLIQFQRVRCSDETGGRVAERFGNDELTTNRSIGYSSSRRKRAFEILILLGRTASPIIRTLIVRRLVGFTAMLVVTSASLLALCTAPANAAPSPGPIRNAAYSQCIDAPGGALNVP